LAKISNPDINTSLRLSIINEPWRLNRQKGLKSTTRNSQRQPFEPFKMNKLPFPEWSVSREIDGSKNASIDL